MFRRLWCWLIRPWRLASWVSIIKRDLEREQIEIHDLQLRAKAIIDARDEKLEALEIQHKVALMQIREIIRASHVIIEPYGAAAEIDDIIREAME